MALFKLGHDSLSRQAASRREAWLTWANDQADAAAKRSAIDSTLVTQANALRDVQLRRSKVVMASLGLQVPGLHLPGICTRLLDSELVSRAGQQAEAWRFLSE
eukprot:TRINITY_DN19548_c0_g1_i3.p1 TRINITY_DN19548_c0_g1~~TRINITY_DN19548_c0_g1_i3.p1  ORF type:complete len:103 (-),score=16.67 TRINITY_DN19548_c0_g1_i3:82-390(-)